MPIQSIYGLVTGHSSFFQVMLSDKVEKSDFKGKNITIINHFFLSVHFILYNVI